jgi:hypothetical protein
MKLQTPTAISNDLKYLALCLILKTRLRCANIYWRLRVFKMHVRNFELRTRISFLQWLFNEGQEGLSK